MSVAPVAALHEHAALVRRLRKWLATGRIRAASGAYCAWCEGGRGTPVFEYPEITGYALTWLAGRSALSTAEVAAGQAAAEWLCARLEAGLLAARSGWDGGCVYVFDLAMVAAGLCSFARRAGAERHEAAGRALAARLATLMGSGALPTIDPGGPPTTRDAIWSNAGRAHLAKAVQALLLVGEDEAAARVVRSAMAEQHEDGRFATQPSDDTVMLHPHFYAVEGLWMWGRARGDVAALERARAATEWAWRHQLRDGGLPQSVDTAGDASAPERNDVTAQAIRAALLTGADAPGLGDAVERLASQCRPVRGGMAIVYAPEPARVHHNAWVTMFGAQALELAGEGADDLRWEALV